MADPTWLDETPARTREVERLLALFADAGALRMEPDILQPADVLLDLYGEDIRARAYRTDDPVLGEQMLRPDFSCLPILPPPMNISARIPALRNSATMAM